MRSIFQKNQAYFIIIIPYFLIGIVLLFLINKGDLVIFFSDNRSTFSNQFFLFANMLGEHYSYLIGLLVLLFIKFRYALFLPVVAVFTAFCSFFLKMLFAHPRPKIWAESEGVLLNYLPDFYVNVGHTSFPSGHTFSSFAVFTYFALISRSPILKIIFALMAIFGGLARVYLSQHFLQDILFGGVLGIGVAIVVYFLQNKLSGDAQKWWNKRINIKA